MKRAIFLTAGGFAVFLSYLAAIVGPAQDVAGSTTVASIILPGLVSAAVMLAYAAWESRNYHAVKGRNEELSAQLVRKEIEIGRLATVDELTGLYTRREFEETIRLEFERARRHTRDLALILVEIDDIASLGERVGAMSRGYLLFEISSVLRGNLRANDFGCRYTNESMALLLPETGADGARAVSEKIREAVSHHEFLGQLGGVRVQLTVSQGIAISEARITGADDLMRAAESALYDARAAGFDCVRIYKHQPVVDARDDATRPFRLAG